jgi:hypothetical protein
MAMVSESPSIDRFIEVIRKLPSDAPVAPGTRGYNRYQTQKDHWLGWLVPAAGTGTYARSTKPGREARDVYNRIGEPMMLLWLLSAGGLSEELINAAKEASMNVKGLARQCKEIRRLVPWADVAMALQLDDR